MDHCNLPSCALNRQATTVIIRNKMDITDKHCQFEVCPNSNSPKAVHRPSGCENCIRTRLNSQYSDCDSDLVGKCRTYKSRAAKSRYVNVCAVVCLLLLVGGLSPRSSAAPYRSRTMDRQKRAADDENELWGNPCNYSQSGTKSAYTPENAQYVLRQAKFAYEEAAKYKDEFANKLYTVSSFNELSSTMSENQWLRIVPWFREEVLPKDKVLSNKVPAGSMNELMNKIDEVLPSMYKSLKMVLAGLHVLTESLRTTDISSDAKLSESLNKSMMDVRSILCYFYDLMVARNLKIEPLRDSEIPEITQENQLSTGFLIYRDTLNYLEYLTQVFGTMAVTDLPTA